MALSVISYLGGLVDADGVLQGQTVRQRHLAASLQTSELEVGGRRQQLHKPASVSSRVHTVQ